tara:strand:+ start:537 stop:767 length:231 start_codon:yes stop_codon:yes gene_type:complete
MHQQPFLIIPRNDGVAVSINGSLHIKKMDSKDMLRFASRCFEAAMEMITEEERAKDSASIREGDIGQTKSQQDVPK